MFVILSILFFSFPLNSCCSFLFCRVLLKRISKILTEPARDTVAEYDAMKKLVVPKNQGRARVSERIAERIRNNKFFESLRKQKPVYSVAVWEKEYKHQVRWLGSSFTSLSRGLV
jgi:hypothetical protein